MLLRGLDFEINNGEYVSVVGDNGCGKSTLLKLLLRLEKPTGGSVTCDAKALGYVPQRTEVTGGGFPITVFEVLDSYRRIIRCRDKNAVSEALRMVGMAGERDRLIDTLSGGQRQKVFVARALIGEPELLILDEPSTGIDLGSQKDIYDILKRLNTEKGITIVSVEHNLTAALSNSTLIYHLHNGHGHICSPEQYAAEYLSYRPEGRAN